ncbi:hypothetical protein F5B19DRAFT_41672 [Rostrohypoxylon terebratum]|nr:hypothetical protein F5B19DRAFT_41672 [Rostrohypoxylon terebratum]
MQPCISPLMMEQTSTDQQWAQHLQMPAMPAIPMIQQPMAQQPFIQQPILRIEPIIPPPIQSLIPQGSFSNAVQPNNVEQRMGRLIYDLDGESIVEDVDRWPISGNCVISCSFKAIPLSPLGIQFRKLSDYGRIIEETPDKLVIRFKHRNPEMIQLLIRLAWINKYMDFGVQCRMHCGPLLQYQTIEMILERVVDQPRPTSEHSTPNKPTLTTKDGSTEDKHSIGTAGEGDDNDSGGKEEVQHPNVDYDYFSEYQYQFVQLNLKLVTPMPPYQSHSTYQPQQSHGAHENQTIHQECRGHPAPTFQGHQRYQGRWRLPDHQLQAYCDNQGYQGPSTFNGYQESQGYQGYRINTPQQTDRGNASNVGLPMPHWNGRRFHRENNRYSTPQGQQKNRYNQRNGGHRTSWRHQTSRLTQGSADRSAPQHQPKYINESNEGDSTPRGQQAAHIHQRDASPVTVYTWQEAGNNPEPQAKTKNNGRTNRRGGYRGRGRGGGNVGDDAGGGSGGGQNPPSDAGAGAGPVLPSGNARGTKRPREEATEDEPATKGEGKKAR